MQEGYFLLFHVAGSIFHNPGHTIYHQLCVLRSFSISGQKIPIYYIPVQYSFPELWINGQISEILPAKPQTLNPKLQTFTPIFAPLKFQISGN